MCLPYCAQMQAFLRWSRRLIAAPLLQELQQAAAEAELPLPRYVAQLLEADMAARRLPRCSAQGEARVQGSEATDDYSPETYRLALSKS